MKTAAEFSRFTLAGGMQLDARRAVWLEKERTLAVADLHLGFPWAHRQSGNLLPLTAPEETLPRLLNLLDDYPAASLVLLGDIVHRPAPLPALKNELCALVETLEKRTELVVVVGNHDRQLAALFKTCGIETKVCRSHRAGDFLLVHGDSAEPVENAREPSSSRIIIGHEHPAISLGDGATTSAKCPCFVAGPDVLVLPAFSTWAAGSDIRSYPPSSPLIRERHLAVAILGDKLLPLRL